MRKMMYILGAFLLLSFAQACSSPKEASRERGMDYWESHERDWWEEA